jgi:hypothetical protein
MLGAGVDEKILHLQPRDMGQALTGILSTLVVTFASEDRALSASHSHRQIHHRLITMHYGFGFPVVLETISLVQSRVFFGSDSDSVKVDSIRSPLKLCVVTASNLAPMSLQPRNA